MDLIPKTLTSSPSEKLRISYKTMYEMLTDRGYELPEEAKIDDEDQREKLRINAKDGNGKKCVVKWCKDAKCGITTISEIAELMESEKIGHVIFVIQGASISPAAKASLKNLKTEGKRIEIFTEEELQYNVSKHEYVPKHRLCTKLEKETLFKQYGIDNKKCPSICTSDPQARYLGAEKGQLIEIIRKSDVLKGYETFSYRVVV